jgi:predicted phage terminase large subunit-like protein
VHVDRVTGQKDVRAMPFAAQCEAGNVRLVLGQWNREYIDELCAFPNGSHDDQVDASSGAFNKLTLGMARTARSWQG